MKESELPRIEQKIAKETKSDHAAFLGYVTAKIRQQPRCVSSLFARVAAVCSKPIQQKIAKNTSNAER